MITNEETVAQYEAEKTARAQRRHEVFVADKKLARGKKMTAPQKEMMQKVLVETGTHTHPPSTGEAYYDKRKATLNVLAKRGWVELRDHEGLGYVFTYIYATVDGICALRRS